MIPESNDDDEEEENELRIQGNEPRGCSFGLLRDRGLSRWRRATTRGGISKKSLMLTNGSSRVEDGFLTKRNAEDSACSAKLGDDPIRAFGNGREVSSSLDLEETRVLRDSRPVSIVVSGGH
ncbi:hypothetical protein BC829DRAFT_418875 [Chytridium lagenaria]|nr:hypothetical protein BC829DRAFT_418875 [Chytridium lagenaria]